MQVILTAGQSRIQGKNWSHSGGCGSDPALPSGQSYSEHFPAPPLADYEASAIPFKTNTYMQY